MTDQQVSVPSEDDRASLARLEEWVAGHYDEGARHQYQSVAGKLRLLQGILDGRYYTREQTPELQSLGATFGAALAESGDLVWRIVEDEYGRDYALIVEDTSIVLFPMTMISKRIERGEDVDVAALHAETLKAVGRARKVED